MENLPVGAGARPGARPGLDARYRPEVDGLRALAVSSVVLFHLGVARFGGGYVGVDVFFVISGFLITRLISAELETTGRFRFTNFYVRRVRRLFPALFFTVALCLLFSFLLFAPDHLRRAGGAIVATMVSVSNVYFWSEAGYFDASALVKPLLHTWSLSVEEQFYMIWPALLAALLPRASRRLALLAMLTIGALSLWLNLAFAPTAPAWVPERVVGWFEDPQATIFYLTPFRIFEFVIGAVLVWVIRFQPRKPMVLDLLLLLGLMMIAGPVLLYTDATLFPSYNALLPCVGAALVIYAGQARCAGPLLCNRAMVGVGLVSYSWYLVHWPLIVFYGYYRFETLGAVEKGGIFVVSLLLATAMYRWVERPFRVRVEGVTAWPTSRRLVLGAIAVALPVVAVSSMAWAQQGWKWRVPFPIEEIHDGREVTFHRTTAQKDIRARLPRGNIYTLGSRRKDARRALVIGDSHANMMTALFERIGLAYNINFAVYWYPGCPPIFHTFKIYNADKAIGRNSPMRGVCRALVTDWQADVKASGYDYVVLAARWDWLFEPGQYGDFTIRQDFLVDEARPEYSRAGSRRAFERNLALTIRAIKRAGSAPVVFSQVPPMGKHVTGCSEFPRYLIGQESIAKRCRGATRAMVLERLRFTNQTIRRVAQREGAAYLLPTQFFCERRGRYCKMFESERFLYGDDSHLNWTGALYLAQRWEAADDFPFRLDSADAAGASPSNDQRVPDHAAPRGESSM